MIWEERCWCDLFDRRPCSGDRLFGNVLAEHSVFPHFVVERNAADSEMPGSVGAAEVVLEQGLFDHFLFGDFHPVFERFPSSHRKETGDRGVVGGAGVSGNDMGGETVRSHSSLLAVDDSAADGIFEFANISGPGVLQ